MFMPAWQCLGTKKNTFEGILASFEVSISVKKYCQKIRNGGTFFAHVPSLSFASRTASLTFPIHF